MLSKELETWPNKYTQREWDRTVGWGEVPKEYKHEKEVKNEILHTQTNKVDRTDNTDD